MELLKEIEVFLYGQKVGTLFDDGEKIVFYYSQSFKAKVLEISPLLLNTQKTKGPYVNTDYPEIYKYLPGIIRDSLPDSNGEQVMDRYFEAKGLNPAEISVLHRLAFIGDRGMGALEYRPKENDSTELSEEMISASELYIQNKNIHQKGKVLNIDEILSHLVDSASPVGGAKQKTLICFDKETKKLKFCKNGDKNYEAYLLKFDSDDRHKEETKKEFIYMSLARDCGIEVMDFELLKDGDRSHYLIKRFDRIDGKKIHMATASALLHKPHVKNGISYEELARLTYTLSGSKFEVLKLIRQMIFNILLAVTDDHAKNFSFLMDEKGLWRLSPAYDLIYGLGVGALNHKTTLCGKNSDFKYEDIFTISKEYGIDDKEIEDIVINIVRVFSGKFEIYADEVDLMGQTFRGMKEVVDLRIEGFFE